MRKRLRVCLSFVAAMLLCIAMSLCIAACAEDPKNPPVKVSDGTSAELSVGETETFAVADYITANGSPVTAESSDDAVATAAVIEKVYMQIVSSDGSKTVTLPNFDWSDAADSVTVRGCTLVSYKANLIEYGFALGEKVYIRITDNGTRDYGLFFLDSVITYYPDGNEPDDTFRLVSKYRILNGGFETGNLTGWTLSRAEGSEGDIGTVTSQDTYWQNTDFPTAPYGKDGTYLFSFWTWEGDDQTGYQNNREGFTGTLTSSIFTLKAGATVCFLLGGGGGNPDVYLEFVNANTGEVIAKFMNTSPKDAQLIRYYYRFTELSKDTECYSRVTDNATSSWGCFTLDGIEVNCASSTPEGFNAAVNQISVTEE